MKKQIVLCLALGILSSGVSAEQSVPAYGLMSLSSFDHLWVYTGKVQAGMFSSTDPKGGNMDMIYAQGKYQGEKVLAKIDGPGCIYRIWSALPSGRLKVYLDGAEKPEIECGFKEYLKGKCPGLPNDFIAGHANYMPIPFAKSIIITAPGFIFPAYYQVSYQTYDKSVKVESFKKERALSEPTLESARRLWRETPETEPELGLIRAESTTQGSGEIVLELKGTGIIRKLIIKNLDDPSDPLAGLRLKVFWDHNLKPAIDVPVDAFFLNQPDLKAHWPQGSLKSLFIYAGKDGYACTFPMPFKDGAKIYLLNASPGQRIQILAFWEKRDALPENAMRFYAFYREEDYESKVSKETTIKFWTPLNPETNYLVLEREGKGHYLGAGLFVKSIGTLWWGEGDEMVWIDGAKKPQIQGTGTEDEFNWAWGFQPEQAPVSGTLPVIPPCKESILAQFIPALRNPECKNLIGNNIAYRFRVSDYLPFEKSIKASYEVLGTSWVSPLGFFAFELSQARGDDYASIAYWYQLP